MIKDDPDFSARAEDAWEIVPRGDPIPAAPRRPVRKPELRGCRVAATAIVFVGLVAAAFLTLSK